MSGIFLSHSSKDKEFARKLAAALERASITVWLDEIEIRVGDSLFDEISGGLTRAKHVGVILSPDSVSSEWVKREVNAALIEEISERRTRVLPILYRDCDVPLFLREKLYADFRGSDTDGDLFAEQVSRLVRTVLSQAGANQGPGAHDSMFELLYLLLLLDQFPNGIWGASLESSADLYGHAGDPGSITISTSSSFAITQFTGSRSALPIQKYRNYLQHRQSARGAFGMQRETGTLKFPNSEILEHARHTATGLCFFLFYDGYEHPRVIKALGYLLNNRTPEGLWVDIGQAVSENVDPMSVAFIIYALEEVYGSQRKKDFSSDIDGKRLLAHLDECIQTGLEYIFN